VVQHLKDKYALDQASDVVVSGCSAGGLATYINIDWYKSVLNPKTVLTGLPDSGFFLDYNSSIVLNTK